MLGEFPVQRILSELESIDLLPAILFRTSRRQCDSDIDALLGKQKLYLGQEQQSELQAQVELVIEKYALDSDVVLSHPHYEALVKTGIGAHHAGQLLVWRLLLEELMSASRLRLMIATGTVAAGVDFPARSVVVTAHSRRGTEGFNVLSSSEFQQMSGRAGRRGKDVVGFCLIAPSPYCDARVLHQVASKPPEALRSAYFASPSTVLNLLKYRNVDDLRYTVERSLGAFLDRKTAQEIRNEAGKLESQLDKTGEVRGEKGGRAQKRIRRKYREADRLEMQQNILLETSLNGLERLGHLNNGQLTDKGSWAAELCTSLVLELAEAVDQHLFTDRTIEELVALVAAIAGDSYREYFSLKRNPIDKELYITLDEGVKRVANLYQGSPFASEVRVNPDAAVTVLTWIEADSWDDFASLLRLGGVAEGDAARLITQTADHLHQLSRLMDTHTELARLALDARGLLLRPPVTEALEVISLD